MNTLARLTSLIVEAEDKGIIAVKRNLYPSDFARWLMEREVIVRGTPWIADDPVTYFPLWRVYKLMAEGFSWKGRRHK